MVDQSVADGGRSRVMDEEERQAVFVGAWMSGFGIGRRWGVSGCADAGGV